MPGSYRPEIDGLRALAVLSVLFFHARLGPLHGGFAGVDVFFVISGFLITEIIRREQERGEFSLARFWARRARRIGPALLLVCAACIPAAMVLMTGAQLTAFFRMLAGVSVGIGNFVLASSSGYFDAPAETRPLLHTWSLAVEEQFYLVYPLVLLAAAGLARRRLVALLLALALLSLVLAEAGWRWHGTANFFFPQGRAWELLAGCIAALVATRVAAWPAGRRELPAALGLVALLVAFLAFDVHTPTPGVALLLPVLGTVAVLLCARQDTWTGRLLSIRPLVGVGLISYSAYLWHQPLLAFARIWLEGPLPLAWRWAVVALTLVLAALSWKWVERPFRRPLGAAPGATLKVAMGASLGLGLGLGLGLVGAAGTFPAADNVLPHLPTTVVAAFQPPPRSKDCFDVAGAHQDPAGWCQVNPGAQARPSFMLFGDSHALQLLEAFESAARASGRSGLFTGYSGCPPLLEVVSLTMASGPSLDCEALNRQVLALVRQSGIRDLYLVGKWSYYTHPWDGGPYFRALGRTAREARSVENSRVAFAHGHAATVQAYAAIGVRIHVVEQVPQQVAPPNAVYERALRSRRAAGEVLAEASVPLATHRALQAFPVSVLRTQGLPAREVLSFDDLFCDDLRCSIGTPTEPWYQDLSHLSEAGARRLVPRLTQLLREASPQLAADDAQARPRAVPE